MHQVSKSRFLALAIAALFPCFLKRPIYRLFFGYQIGKRVRIGFSIIDAKECAIDDDAHIGHFNLVIGVKKLSRQNRTPEYHSRRRRSEPRTLFGNNAFE